MTQEYELTPTQTVGPYFSLGMMKKGDNILAGPETSGERIHLEGRIFDGDGDPLFNVLVEIWQANSSGRYNHPDDKSELPLDPDFIGFGRASTDATGKYVFETIMPGAVPYDEVRMQSPHILMTVFASGVSHPLVTRMYFSDDPELKNDPILQNIPEHRRKTLIAKSSEKDGVKTYTFDLVLRGQAEDLVLEGKVMAEASASAPKGTSRDETVFLALD